MGFSHSASAKRRVKKVIIPVAGMGTRFMPATKAIPKELLPIIDTPIIHLIVNEAVQAGLETVIFISSRPKVAIEDYFDPGDLTALKLEQKGSSGLIESVLELSRKIDIVTVRQYETRGLGHAILQAAPVVGDENFAVILGDDIVWSEKQAPIGQCIESFSALERGSVVGVLEVPRQETALYGIVDLKAAPKGGSPQAAIRKFVEKPAPDAAPSTWAMPGRYVFENHLMSVLEGTPPGKNGEIQLTDAMEMMLKDREIHARFLEGERFDTGDKLGYIKANVAFALKHPKYKEALRAWLKETLSV